jgi:hypothetical protein
MLIAVLVSAIGLAACSGGTNSPANGSQPAGSSSNTSAQTGEVAFAQCVRAHGVPDFPDPQNGHFLISGSDQSDPNFQSAVQTCQHLLPGGSASNGGSGANSSAELAFAHCMQTHGVPNFPDPSASGALGIPPGIDASSPQFQSAFHACSSLLPNNGSGLGS